eukprot:CAMPEP_0178398588 /NCGR_PEP_ID=MMETSP0689_2-20121128/14850_1 /TAXON_ID=160604 /ORGANISM="Amphidinium massartii, Strain CS-259" /LENGTH=68 /DNA_ID=CAMNT_0020019355 /DNA_START=120 /DNA_END=326 /DNA_ORIENTATION=-
MFGGMGDKMKEQAKKQIEDKMAEQAPAYIKPFFPCCGGPVGTVDKFIFTVPKDQQDDVKKAIEKYKGL